MLHYKIFIRKKLVDRLIGKLWSNICLLPSREISVQKYEEFFYIITIALSTYKRESKEQIINQ